MNKLSEYLHRTKGVTTPHPPAVDGYLTRISFLFERCCVRCATMAPEDGIRGGRLSRRFSMDGKNKVFYRGAGARGRRPQVLE